MTNKEVRLFGLGCNLSRHLLSNMQMAARELNLELSVEEVSDIQEMMDLGITAIPALQIGNNVVVSGQVPEIEELKTILRVH